MDVCGIVFGRSLFQVSLSVVSRLKLKTATELVRERAAATSMWGRETDSQGECLETEGIFW